MPKIVGKITGDNLEATQDTSGLMSSSDKRKTDGLINIKSIGKNLNLDENGKLSAEDSFWEQGTAVGALQTKDSGCSATKDYAIAEGYSSIASKEFAHADGFEAVASGLGAHAEGEATQARAEFSHTEGSNTIAVYDPVTGANAVYAHAEGNCTIVNNLGEHAEGNFNISNVGHYGQYPFADNTLHSVGMGTSAQRKNAFEIMQNGDIYMVGTGGYDGTNPGNASTIQSALNNLKLLVVPQAVLTLVSTSTQTQINNAFGGEAKNREFVTKSGQGYIPLFSSNTGTYMSHCLGYTSSLINLQVMQTNQIFVYNFYVTSGKVTKVEPIISSVVSTSELAVYLGNYLAKDNTTSYTPSSNYHPATKKYVDDNKGLTSVPNASSTTVGGLKVRLSGTTLYIRNDGGTP